MSTEIAADALNGHAELAWAGLRATMLVPSVAERKGDAMWKSVGVMSVWTTSSARQLAVAAMVALLSGAAGVGGLPHVGQVQAATLEGQKFEDSTVLAGRTLRLNGLGLRGVAWIKAYVTGLYLAAPSKDVSQILAMQGPKRLRMKVMLEAGSQEYSKAFLKGVKRNEPEKVQQALAERMTAFAAQIDGLKVIRAGDVVDMDYLPGVGTQLRLNNKAVGAAIEGEDFYRALLKIYIGDKPADKKMKEGLLRGGNAD
jgi:Chalcone isomerase-like